MAQHNHAMKNISALSLLAALAAAVLLPLSAAVAGTLLIGGGLAALMIADYAPSRRLALPGEKMAAMAAGSRAERLRLAA